MFGPTLSGIRNSKECFAQGQRILQEALVGLCDTRPTQITFDSWHQQACLDLKAEYRKCGYTEFTIGQSQKWINMALKYIFVMGKRIDGFGHVYDLCHAPLDNYLIKALGKEFPALGCSWSRLDDYDEYLNRQEWIRYSYPGPLLDTENYLWLEYARRGSR